MADVADAAVGSPGSKEAIGAVEENNADAAEGSPGRNEALGAEGGMAAISRERPLPRAESVADGKIKPVGAVEMPAMDDAAEGRTEERPVAAEEVESMDNTDEALLLSKEKRRPKQRRVALLMLMTWTGTLQTMLHQDEDFCLKERRGLLCLKKRGDREKLLLV